MNILPALIVFLIVLALPVAWLVSEFRATSRRVRCTLGVLAIVSSFGVAWITAQLTRLNYNAWYGFSAKALVDAVVEKLDAGQGESVKTELKALQSQFHPTYENRAHFNDLVDVSVKRMRGEGAADQVPEDAVRKVPSPQH